MGLDIPLCLTLNLKNLLNKIINQSTTSKILKRKGLSGDSYLSRGAYSKIYTPQLTLPILANTAYILPSSENPIKKTQKAKLLKINMLGQGVALGLGRNGLHFLR